jgi:signal transduction histidine kinase
MRSLAGRTLNVCLFSRDITDSKLLEGRLAHAKEMEAVWHQVGGISHDFNNILGVIRGTGELLSLNLGAAHPQQKYLSQLLRSTDVAVALTRQLQAFSRQQAIKPKAANSNDAVTEVR